MNDTFQLSFIVSTNVDEETLHDLASMCAGFFIEQLELRNRGEKAELIADSLVSLYDPTQS